MTPLFLFQVFRSDDRQDRTRFKGYAEEIVPLYTPDEFKLHFRVSRRTCEKLMQNIVTHGQLKVNVTHGGRQPVSVEKHVLLGLWTISTKEKYTSIADRFGISESTAFTTFSRFCTAVVRCSDQYLQWPSKAKQQAIAEDFYQLCSLPGITGAVDGTHIALMAPRQSPEDYVNRKGFHSINLQLVVAADKTILRAYCGFPGSVHDSRVLQNSEFFYDAPELINDECYIIGDSAYPLKKWLVVPYKNNGHLSAKQKKFNRHLSRGRVVVENTIGMLKGRFRRLKYLEMYNLNEVQMVISAACVLHNVCILEGESYDEPLDEVEEEVNDFVATEPDTVTGKTKRDQLAAALWDN